MGLSTNEFPRDTSGLPAASATPVVELADGDRFALRIAPVTKRIGDATVRMLAYNGSIPGPTLRVPEGAELVVDVENEGDLEATVHWHGLRLENRGVTDVPGLYFLGLLWQHTRGSALLGWVKDDARFIAERIRSRATSSAQVASEAGSR